MRQWSAAVAQGNEEWSAFDLMVSSALLGGTGSCTGLTGAPLRPPLLATDLLSLVHLIIKKKNNPCVLPLTSRHPRRGLWPILGSALMDTRWPRQKLQRTLGPSPQGRLHRLTLPSPRPIMSRLASTGAVSKVAVNKNHRFGRRCCVHSKLRYCHLEPSGIFERRLCGSNDGLGGRFNRVLHIFLLFGQQGCHFGVGRACKRRVQDMFTSLGDAEQAWLVMDPFGKTSFLVSGICDLHHESALRCGAGDNLQVLACFGREHLRCWSNTARICPPSAV